MYSFAQHPSVGLCLDEPLYSRHLLENPHLERPYAAELHASQPYSADLDKCWDVLRSQSEDPSRPAVFMKHMAKHFPCLKVPQQSQEVTEQFLLRDKHLLLLRDPLKVINSFSKGAPCTLEEIGLADLVSLYDVLTGSGERVDRGNVIVVDSERLLADPENTLRKIMGAFGFGEGGEEKMLTWPAGPKPYDGVWASHWYGNTHKSSGFSAKTTPPAYKTLSAGNADLYRTALPLFLSLLGRCVASPTFGQGRAPLHYAGERGGGGALLPDAAGALAAPAAAALARGAAARAEIRVKAGKCLAMRAVLERVRGDVARRRAAFPFGEAHSAAQMREAVFQVLAANGMRDGVRVEVVLAALGAGRGTTLVVSASWEEGGGEGTGGGADAGGADADGADAEADTDIPEFS
ncbi:hypothetical protein TeGR_g11641 [Tetraparma gracilis]|nr:hypothetical protein TeGR_g11641 [Tetraparma gracilis]